MDRLLNFFCFPLLLLGLIFISNGFVGFVENNNVDTQNNIQSANQINKLYSEKEITLVDNPQHGHHLVVRVDCLTFGM